MADLTIDINMLDIDEMKKIILERDERISALEKENQELKNKLTT